MNEEPANLVEQDAKKRKVQSFMIAAAVLLIALIADIAINNTPANRLSRQLDLGNRYLNEQNYELAIVEFDKVIAIDPMNVEAYLGKADAYIGMRDLSSALQTIQTGYDLTGDDRLEVKLMEIQAQLEQSRHVGETVFPIEEEQVEKDYVELPFRMSDIKIMGYDFLESHFNDVYAAFGITREQSGNAMVGRVNNPYGINVENLPRSVYDEFGIEAISHIDSESQGQISIYAEHDRQDDYYRDNILNYNSDYYDNRLIVSMSVTNALERTDVEKICDMPVYPEDTYDELFERMKVEMIKSSVEMQFEEENQYWNSVMDSQKILSEDGWYVAGYQEGIVDSGATAGKPYCSIVLMNEAGAEFYIGVELEDGIVSRTYLTSFCGSD